MKYYSFKICLNLKYSQIEKYIGGGHVETTESEAEAVIPLKNSHGENR